MLPQILVTLVLTGTVTATAPTPFTAVCTQVFDGDTILVRRPDGREERVRYTGVDTPEMDEPGGRRAAALNRVLVLNREVTLQPAREQTDPYGRLLARPAVCGVDVEAALLAAGLARRWRK